MIADEYPKNIIKGGSANFSFDKNRPVELIIDSLKRTVPHFKSYLLTKIDKKYLNEDELTQVFVEQLDIQIRKLNLPFGVKNEYQDIYSRSPGYSDFYFHPIEEFKSTASLFSVECKRLPAPTKSREKEYLIGNKKNGGIERYKLEIHGRGLSNCGMLAFIEDKSTDHWLKSINEWIYEIAESDKKWRIKERLIRKEKAIEFTYLHSVVYTISQRKVKLHHFWLC